MKGQFPQLSQRGFVHIASQHNIIYIGSTHVKLVQREHSRLAKFKQLLGNSLNLRSPSVTGRATTTTRSSAQVTFMATQNTVRPGPKNMLLYNNGNPSRSFRLSPRPVKKAHGLVPAHQQPHQESQGHRLWREAMETTKTSPTRQASSTSLMLYPDKFNPRTSCPRPDPDWPKSWSSRMSVPPTNFAPRLWYMAHEDFPRTCAPCT